MGVGLLRRAWINLGLIRGPVLVVALSAVPVLAAGQTVTDQRVWTGVTTQGRIAPESSWRWSTDSLVRSRDGARTLDFLAQRVVVSRDLTRRSSLGGGYAYGAGFPDDGGTLPEHRIMQQYVWTDAVARGRLSLRTRLEERFIEGRGRMLLRGRQQVRVAWPIGASRRRHLVGYDEVFLFLNSTALAPRGLDSNRAFIGIREATGRNSELEAGYLNVFTRGRAGRNRHSHILSATLIVSF